MTLSWEPVTLIRAADYTNITTEEATQRQRYVTYSFFFFNHVSACYIMYYLVDETYSLPVIGKIFSRRAFTGNFVCFVGLLDGHSVFYSEMYRSARVPLSRKCSSIRRGRGSRTLVGRCSRKWPPSNGQQLPNSELQIGISVLNRRVYL